MGNVWNHEVDDLGYRAPLPDRGTTRGTGQDEARHPPRRLPRRHRRRRLYGYAATDRTPARPSLGLPRPRRRLQRPRVGAATPAQLLRVTAAHEFFHIVQFAYDQYEDGWFMESTATWMEERVYDAVNDNRQFLPVSALALPGRSLDSPLPTPTWYGNWIFFEFLSRRLGTCVVRSMWSRAASRTASTRRWRSAGPSRPRAPACAPGSRASPPTTSPRRAPTPRASHLPPARRSPATYTLSTGKRAPVKPGRQARPPGRPHYAFAAGASLTGAREVRLAVNGPVGISGAIAIVQPQDGTLTAKVRSGSAAAGNGSLTLPLLAAAVNRVTLTLVEHVRAATPAAPGGYSCNGAARDQNQPFTFSASAIR